jgi:histidinol phosphatase-like PHP family hydrolase
MDKNSEIGINDYHIHTNVTEGKMSPEEIIRQAKAMKIKTIAFTEHISKEPTYDWFKFRKKIDNLNVNGIRILVGVEAKVLNRDGSLNVNDDILDAADIILGAVHGNGNAEWLLNSKCDIIAHPQINSKNIKNFINCNKVLEISSRHKLPFNILDKLIINTNNVFSFGSDTHMLEDFVNAQKYFRKIIKRYPNIKMIKKVRLK